MEQEEFSKKVRKRLKIIYGNRFVPEELITHLLGEIERIRNVSYKNKERWNEQDIILITYGDSIKKSGQRPLITLKSFLKKFLGDSVNYVHILPFFPYSSDDGFSVIDYLKVNPDLGDWNDIASLTEDYLLMVDLVVNHISKHSCWFKNYLKAKDPGKDYFIEVDPETDLSEVVRPRSLPLLTSFDTAYGEKHVWTTFSADQADLNFANPEVLIEMLKVLLYYFEKGARIIRLDAIAFLWKEIGTSCLHLPQTHEVVKLMRDLADYTDPQIIIITETNVPNKENLRYFGEGDEAHMVYQFSLPPLLLHALNTANSKYLTSWAKEVKDIPQGCTFFNFTASHDGIGVRPLEGLLPQNEILQLAEAMKSYGGYVSTKKNSDGTDSPYELNITYLDALKHTSLGEDNFQKERFICSQTLMMSFKGIPAFYIHSLLGTHNFNEGVSKTGMPRTINRRKWDADDLHSILTDNTEHFHILNELKRRINIRKKIPAFHPDSKQDTIQADKALFVLLRGDKSELLVISNISPAPVSFGSINLPFEVIGRTDLLSGAILKESFMNLQPYQVMWIEKKQAGNTCQPV